MLERLNQWLLLLSHVGIIGGLVLVGFQINQNSELIQQNTKAIRAQELSSFSDAQTQLDAAVIGENVGEAYAKALYSPADMSPAEIEQVVHYVSSRVSLLHRMYRAHQAGTVAKEDWEQQLHEIPIWLGSTFGQLFWEMSKHDYLSQEFVQAVDRAIASAGPKMREDACLVEVDGSQSPRVARGQVTEPGANARLDNHGWERLEFGTRKIAIYFVRRPAIVDCSHSKTRYALPHIDSWRVG